jgi:biuret amidohydrolase
MQRDFVEPGGFGETLGNKVALLQAIIPATARLLAAFRAAGLPVIHTRECHRARTFPIARPPSASVASRLYVSAIPVPWAASSFPVNPAPTSFPNSIRWRAKSVLDKPGKGAFYATPLVEILAERKIGQLVFAGVTTEVCVQTTMREANDRGFECLLATDATESYFPEFKAATLAMIRAQGAIVGWTATTDAVRRALGV